MEAGHLAVRYLFAILILLLAHSPAFAFLPHGAGGTACANPSQVPSNPGSSISAANTNCTLRDLTGATWSVDSTFHVYKNGVFQQFGGAIISGDGHVFIVSVLTTCDTPRATVYRAYSEYGTSGEIGIMPGYLSAGIPVADSGGFVNTHSGGGSTTYNNATASLTNAVSGDTLAWGAQNALAQTWPPIFISETTNNVTININSGAVFWCWAEPWNIAGTGVLVDGGGNGTFLSGASFTGGTSIKPNNNANNVTIRNLSITSSRDTCILTGDASQGTQTITNVTLQYCGWASPGQDHNIYLGAAIAGDDTNNIQVTNLYSFDVIGGGFTFKSRALGAGTQNHVTQSQIGCVTNSGDSHHVCQQSAAVSLPCGGNYLIDHSNLEYLPGANVWAGVRVGDEVDNVTSSRQPSGGCAPTFFINGTIVANTNDVTGIATDPRLSGVRVGDLIVYSPGNGYGDAPLGTTIASFSGSTPSLTMTVTCASPPCFKANASHTQKINWINVTGDSGLAACGNASTICNIKDSLGNALSPTTAHIFTTYQAQGTGVSAGSTISSTTSTTIVLTCASPPCASAETGVVFSFYVPVNVTLDHDILIWDGNGSSGSSGPGWLEAGYNGCGNAGGCIMPTGWRGVISNSILVGQTPPGSGNYNPGRGVVDGTGSAFACGSGGNVCYADRATAGAALAWPATDFQGNPCCAFPYLPPVP